ncbi:N-acetylmannosamine-6-phosphate 2-epimerase [Paenibacillus sp. MER TA 81-3]|uniref:N-acetylmannosamine-6-phosphate 2-epimerase n=1 Tax=Paenibacillus sp. MER TA 81-3 TaxID=2939573 RepID=UPI00203F27D1|nr:N-acetylmannosamine-6-phosphate 2-epimerase [Paenibacillus sp. MER TA 81-3]MCM3338415.1 N-acetylmannosamine-6-phosphate 2-epimerase [Paenibacillus sp. MER TA 81-3]
MEKHILERIQNRLIVSCQALEDEPLHGSALMAKMAMAAEVGGAAGIRANMAKDIEQIKQLTDLPIIGIVKRDYDDSDIYITPTMTEVKELIDVGVDMIALDATRRKRPNGETLEEIIAYAKQHQQTVMADISTEDEALYAASLGVDCVSTTLSGYTPYSPQDAMPNFSLVEKLVKSLRIPVIAEGKINLPSQAARMLQLGVHAVVVGSAITRPQLITQAFVAEIEQHTK